MGSTHRVGAGARRIGRILGLLAAALAATVPIAQLLVWSWQLHPVAVVPAYVLGIPLWLTVLSLAWSGVRRVKAAAAVRREARRPVTAAPAPRVPAPRREGATALVLRTPTP